MTSKTIKQNNLIVHCQPLSDSEWQVAINLDGRMYQDNVSYPGLIKAVKEAIDKTAKQYKVQKSMLEAIEKKLKPKREEEQS